MTTADLQQHARRAVQILVDDKEALGVLAFSESGDACVTTLCFLNSPDECPLMDHKLTEEDIESIQYDGAHLTSAIALKSDGCFRVSAIDTFMLQKAP